MKPDTPPPLSPILKWVGGKRQLLAGLISLSPKRFSLYCEPFLGGGAMLFRLRPAKAVVNDINSELVNVYEVVRDSVEQLIELLRQHRNEAAHFYAVRNLDRDQTGYDRLSPVERAARILYLNKTCYNGLFRVNAAGNFNTPFGRYKNPNIVNADILRAASEYLRGGKISFACTDYAEVLAGLPKKAFVYMDPPYHPVSATANFTSYAKGGFSTDDQVRLKQSCDALDRKGISFMLSNSATGFIRDLYADYRIDIIQARRYVNSVASRRGAVDEIVVRNY